MLVSPGSSCCGWCCPIGARDTGPPLSGGWRSSTLPRPRCPLCSQQPGDVAAGTECNRNNLGQPCPRLHVAASCRNSLLVIRQYASARSHCRARPSNSGLMSVYHRCQLIADTPTTFQGTASGMCRPKRQKEAKAPGAARPSAPAARRPMPQQQSDQPQRATGPDILSHLSRQ